MKIEFTKMHGLGNDVIVIDSLDSGFVPDQGEARFLCKRRLGVGADQVLVLLPSQTADFQMKIINADGSEVEMCGNGIRCLAKYIHDRGISDKNPLEIETLAGIIRPELLGEMVRVDMGEPVFDADKVPVKGEGKISDEAIMVDDHVFRMSAVSMGNPHCVIQVEDVEGVPLSDLGPRLEHHPWFPNRTNVEFVQVLDRARLKVRVWERGAGETLACGTGACAAAVAMIDMDRAERELTITLPGGDLEIKWDRQTNAVWMTGPALEVFCGEVEI